MVVWGQDVVDAQERVPSVFKGRLSAEFESAYLSSSGTLCDTRPTELQNLDWTVRLGDYGKFYGYGAFLSMLHDWQHELHRPAFNEFEGGAWSARLSRAARRRAISASRRTIRACAC